MAETFLTLFSKGISGQECFLINCSNFQTGRLMTAGSDKVAMEFIVSPLHSIWVWYVTTSHRHWETQSAFPCIKGETRARGEQVICSRLPRKMSAEGSWAAAARVLSQHPAQLFLSKVMPVRFPSMLLSRELCRVQAAWDFRSISRVGKEPRGTGQGKDSHPAVRTQNAALRKRPAAGSHLTAGLCPASPQGCLLYPCSSAFLSIYVLQVSFVNKQATSTTSGLM